MVKIRKKDIVERHPELSMDILISCVVEHQKTETEQKGDNEVPDDEKDI